MRCFALALALVPVSVFAEEWVPLNGDEIRAALEGRKLNYAEAHQSFDASGQTVYVTARPSFGRWRVDGDQYCSVWPPSDLWACYDMDRKGDVLRFVGRGDDITEGTYAE